MGRETQKERALYCWLSENEGLRTIITCYQNWSYECSPLQSISEHSTLVGIKLWSWTVCLCLHFFKLIILYCPLHVLIYEFKFTLWFILTSFYLVFKYIVTNIKVIFFKFLSLNNSGALGQCRSPYHKLCQLWMFLILLKSVLINI